MMEIKTYFKALLLMSMLSCGIRGQTLPKNNLIIGKYTTNHLYQSPNFEELILLDENVVKYNTIFETYGNHNLEGKWKFKNDTLNLFFETPPKKIPGVIEVHYGKLIKKSINVNVNDNLGLLFGSKLFIGDKQFNIDSENLEIEAQFIDSVKLEYNGETYETVIDKLVDTDLNLFVKLVQHRDGIYDVLVTTWILKDNKLFKYHEGKLNEKSFLIRSQ